MNKLYCHYTLIIKYLENQYLQTFMLLLLGILGVLGFSPYNFWPASIISLTGLLTTILYTTWKIAARNAFYWGVGFFSSGLYWIYIGISQFVKTNNYLINIIPIIILIIYLTLFPVIFAILLSIIQTYTITIWSTTGTISVLWSITEYLRSKIFTGFPWLQFGYTQIDAPLKGIAPILGVEGITFFLVAISGLIALSIKNMQLMPIIISLSILIVVYPLKWIQWYHPEPQRAQNISLIQGNINQNIKWDIKKSKEILNIYLQHTLPIIGKTKIIIWPESAIPGNEFDYNNFLTDLDHQLRLNQTNLITGIIDARYNNNIYYYYNSIIVIGNSDPYTYPNKNRYEKHHLVLYSEKSPHFIFKKLLSNFMNIPVLFMQNGQYFQPQLIVSNIRFTAVICYEIIFSHQVRDNFKPNTDFLLTIADNSWFGDSVEPWQYFQMMRMRALELGRPLLCSTNNGITAIINANGSINAQLPQFTSQVLNAEIIPSSGLTPYVKIGSYWLYIINTIFFLYLFIKIKKIY